MEDFFIIVKSPWHWAVAGTLIGLIVPALLLMGNKAFGVSSSLRHICAMCISTQIPFFKYNWLKEIRNLFFVSGITLGALSAVQFLSNPNDILLSDAAQQTMQNYQISDLVK